jgi:hypothetical protein
MAWFGMCQDAPGPIPMRLSRRVRWGISMVDRHSFDARALARQAGIGYLTFCRNWPISATRYPIHEAKQPRPQKPEPQTKPKSGSIRLMSTLYARPGFLSVMLRTLTTAPTLAQRGLADSPNKKPTVSDDTRGGRLCETQLGDRDLNPKFLIQSQMFCRLNYPRSTMISYHGAPHRASFGGLWIRRQGVAAGRRRGAAAR